MLDVVVCGDLSARRPGGERTRKPVRLPAERLRHGAISNFSGSARVKLRQKSPRCIRQAFHVFPYLLRCASKHSEGELAACAKKLSSRSISP